MGKRRVYTISACYFPGKGEAELTWEDDETGERCDLTVKVTPEQGEQLAKVVPACVYYTGKTKKQEAPNGN